MATESWGFAVAILIGALVGLDREHRKLREGASHASGIRTFVLIAIAGAVAGWFSTDTGSPWVFGIGALAVAAMMTASYLVESRQDAKPAGLTTEMAGLVVYLLGGLAMTPQRELAVALAVITSAILAYKQSIHQLVTKVSGDDLYAILKLLVASFIVLPFLPDRAIDPLGAVNPYKVWLLVILISAISLVGYVATRWLGAQRGTAITGLVGGLVSSTAVALSFARNSRTQPHTPAVANAIVSGVLLSWVVMFVRVLVLVAVIYPPLLRTLWQPVTAMAVVAAGAALVLYLRGGASAPREAREQVQVKNPFSLWSASKFAALFVIVLVVVKLTQQYAPASGMYGIAALAGLTDVDAISLSMAAQARDAGALDVAAMAITIAIASNTVVKCGLVVGLGVRGLRWPALICTAAVLIAGGVALARGLW